MRFSEPGRTAPVLAHQCVELAASLKTCLGPNQGRKQRRVLRRRILPATWHAQPVICSWPRTARQ